MQNLLYVCSYILYRINTYINYVWPCTFCKTMFWTSFFNTLDSLSSLFKLCRILSSHSLNSITTECQSDTEPHSSVTPSLKQRIQKRIFFRVFFFSNGPLNITVSIYKCTSIARFAINYVQGNAGWKDFDSLWIG